MTNNTYYYTISFNNYRNFFLIKQEKNILLIIIQNGIYTIIGNTFKNNNLNGIYYNNETKVISYSLNKNINNTDISTKNINLYLKSNFDTFFSKIKFVGKGFRIQYFKKKGLLNFTFGHSHMYVMFIQKLFLKKISKNKYFYIASNLQEKNTLNNNFKKIKPINKYTLRGLRVSKSIIVKRKGRKSPNL